MQTFSFEMLETADIRKVYTVEAENLEEAKRKAESGDTVYEGKGRVDSVRSRKVLYES